MSTTTPPLPPRATVDREGAVGRAEAHGRGTCPFCPAWLSTSDSAFDTVVAEGPGLRVLPALGMLVDGYFLATTHEHALSFAAMPATWWGPAWAWLDALLARLATTFGEYVVFEHGSCAAGSAGACVDHAHLHLVPLGAEFCDILLGALPWMDLRSHGQLSRHADRPYAYLTFRGANFVVPDPMFGSQWLRRQIATFIGVGEWDWALAAGGDQLARTLDRLEFAARPDYAERSSGSALPPRCTT